jgi:hypothetical protein
VVLAFTLKPSAGLGAEGYQCHFGMSLYVFCRVPPLSATPAQVHTAKCRGKEQD